MNLTLLCCDMCAVLCCVLYRLYIATGQETYKKAAYDYYMKHYKEEDGPGVWDNFDWDSHSWAAVVLLQRYAASKPIGNT